MSGKTKKNICKYCDGRLDKPGTMQCASYHNVEIVSREQALSELLRTFCEENEIEDIALYGLDSKFKGFDNMSNRALAKELSNYLKHLDKKVIVVD